MSLFTLAAHLLGLLSLLLSSNISQLLTQKQRPPNDAPHVSLAGDGGGDWRLCLGGGLEEVMVEGGGNIVYNGCVAHPLATALGNSQTPGPLVATFLF